MDLEKKYRSVSAQLREAKKSTEEFEIMLNQLTFEEVITLRLELMAKSMNGKIYGFPIFRNFKYMIRHCLLVFSFLYSSNIKEMSMILGTSVAKVWTLIVKERLFGSYESAIEKSYQGRKRYESYLNNNQTTPNKGKYEPRPSSRKVSRVGQAAGGGDGQPKADQGEQKAAS